MVQGTKTQKSATAGSSGKKPTLGFRRWLIDQLKLTQWPRRRDQTPAELAQALGVQLEVLQVAMTELRAEEVARGRLPSTLVRQQDEVVLAALDVTMPEAVWKDWSAYCERRQLAPAVLLRSLVHCFLNQQANPSWVAAYWRYRGQILHISKRKTWPWKAFARVPRGVEIALTRRAKAIGTTRAALLRGIIIDMLEGRTTRIPLIAARAMWNDPERYVQVTKE